MMKGIIVFVRLLVIGFQELGVVIFCKLKPVYLLYNKHETEKLSNSLSSLFHQILYSIIAQTLTLTLDLSPLPLPSPEHPDHLSPPSPDLTEATKDLCWPHLRPLRPSADIDEADAVPYWPCIGDRGPQLTSLAHVEPCFPSLRCLQPTFDLVEGSSCLHDFFDGLVMILRLCQGHLALLISVVLFLCLQ